MSEIFVATAEELRLLTKRERHVYEMFRHEGKTREEIMAELKIGKEAFRRYWWSAVKKIKAHRQMVQNPQYFMARGKDILAGDVTIRRHQKADSQSAISNTSLLGREDVPSDTAGIDTDGESIAPPTDIQTGAEHEEGEDDIIEPDLSML